MPYGQDITVNGAFSFLQPCWIRGAFPHTSLALWAPRCTIYCRNLSVPPSALPTVSLCVCVCVCVYVCMHACACMCVCLWTDVFVWIETVIAANSQGKANIYKPQILAWMYTDFFHLLHTSFLLSLLPSLRLSLPIPSCSLSSFS